MAYARAHGNALACRFGAIGGSGSCREGTVEFFPGRSDKGELNSYEQNDEQHADVEPNLVREATQAKRGECEKKGQHNKDSHKPNRSLCILDESAGCCGIKGEGGAGLRGEA